MNFVMYKGELEGYLKWRGIIEWVSTMDWLVDPTNYHLFKKEYI